MATNIVLPDFDFSAYYYPQLLEALIRYKRINVPELTEELPQDPFIQLIRMMALVGHISNTTIDLVANESFFTTAKLVSTVRSMLKLIGYDMAPATPAGVHIVYELSKVFTTSYTVVNEGAQAATEKDVDGISIPFETNEELTVDRTDQLSYCYGSESGVFTDYTAEANSDVTPANDFTPWTTPVSKDAIYWGHKQVMWDELSIQLTTPSANIEGVFEFYDGNWQKTAPTSVTDIGGGQLQLDLTSLLGTQNRQGTEIRVYLNDTGAYENAFSTWTGSENIVTVGLLGQTTPSTTATEYTIGSDWSILTVTDETTDFKLDGSITYTLPQTTTQHWTKGTVNDLEAYWLRYRIITVSTPTAPTFINCRIDEGKQYGMLYAVQGLSYSDNPLGSSTGLADQSFETTQDYYIDSSTVVTVDDEEWTEVENFLTSRPGDKHYTVELSGNDRATITFGNGVNGRIPPLGVGNISCDYRYGANEDGNVGANTVIIDKTSLSYVNKLWNPRQATGWAEADGASETSLELAKVKGPASLRIKNIAVSADDVAYMAVSVYKDSDGVSAFSRAFAIEEGFGPKTIELVVVAKGGGIATVGQLDGLDEYFNGNKYATPPVESHMTMNQMVSSVNYTPRAIDITATVYGETTVEAVTNRLQKVIQPEALKDDGISYEWEFGGEVPISRISHEIFETSDTITKVVITEPAIDTPLNTRELPITGTLTINVIRP